MSTDAASAPGPVLDVQSARGWFTQFRATFSDHAPLLADLDRRAGDGDFGANLTAALGRARTFLDRDAPQTFAEVFSAVAKGFLNTGGTSGPLFGMWYRELAKATTGEVTTQTIADGVANGLATVQRLAGAEVGDSTMVDALAPAARALAGAAAAEVPAADAVQTAAVAAATGAESTRDLLASRGRASYVGEVARGVLDPGAVAVALFFAAGAAALTSTAPDTGWLTAG